MGWEGRGRETAHPPSTNTTHPMGGVQLRPCPHSHKLRGAPCSPFALLISPSASPLVSPPRGAPLHVFIPPTSVCYPIQAGTIPLRGPKAQYQGFGVDVLRVPRPKLKPKKSEKRPKKVSVHCCELGPLLPSSLVKAPPMRKHRGLILGLSRVECRRRPPFSSVRWAASGLTRHM